MATLPVRPYACRSGPFILMLGANSNTGRNDVQCNEQGPMAVYVEWTGAAVGGSIQLQASNSPTYAGTWATFATVTPKTDQIDVVHITTPVGVLRANLTAPLGVGTVTVTLRMY